MMSSNAERVKSALLGKIGGMGFFGCCETAKEITFPVDHNLRVPSIGISASVSAEQPAGTIILSRLELVLMILRVGGFSKIIPSVIRFVGVAMVDLFCRPSASHIQPRKTMSFVRATVYANMNVSTGMNTSGNIAGSGVVSAVNAPNKQTGLGEVLKKLDQPSMGDNRCSHFATPIRGLVRRPDSVTSACRAFAILPLARC